MKNVTSISKNEVQAIIQLANHKLFQNDPSHKGYLFNEFYRLLPNEKTDDWIVSLQNRDNVTGPVIVLNSEIKAAMTFLDKLERIKRDDYIVAMAFEMSHGSELHALRLAVIGLVAEKESINDTK